VPAVQENIQEVTGKYLQLGGSSEARPLERIPADIARRAEEEDAS